MNSAAPRELDRHLDHRSRGDGRLAWRSDPQMDLTRQRLSAAVAIPAVRVMLGCAPRFRIADCNKRVCGLLADGLLLLRRMLTELYLLLGKSP